ncbi:MAG: hypothetical protein GVY22_16985, partial [Gammaproteobacteria bacterium]|nr:hypothetical protein [Gammaproteobacteria bacterium]
VEAVVERMEPNGGQEARVAEQLALIAAAGELATEAGLTGWTVGAATTAALKAFEAWRNHRGQASAEDQQILEAVRSFIDRHGDSRFSPRNGDSRHVIRDRAGFIDRETDGRPVYLFLPSGLSEAVAGHDISRALLTLKSAGWLKTKDDGGHRLQRKIDGRNTGVYGVLLPDDDGGLA